MSTAVCGGQQQFDSSLLFLAVESTLVPVRSDAALQHIQQWFGFVFKLFFITQMITWFCDLAFSLIYQTRIKNYYYYY